MRGLINPKVARSIQESSDAVLAEPQDFTRLVTLPQLFVFVILILAESLGREEPLSLIVKLAGISYLLLSTVVVQVVVKSLTLRYVCYHQFILTCILCALTLVSGQDQLYNFYLPLTLFVICAYSLRLTGWELAIVFTPVWAVVLFATPLLILIGPSNLRTSTLGSAAIALALGGQWLASKFSARRAQKGKVQYYRTLPQQTQRIKKPGQAGQAPVEEDTEFWYQVYYTMLFQETISELVWRLAILYLLSYSVFAHVFITLGVKSATAVFVPLALALFQLFLHTRLVTHKDYHALLQRVFLLSLGCILSSVIILAVIPGFEPISVVFLLFQILWIGLIPWTKKYALSLAAISLGGVALVTWHLNTRPLFIMSTILIVFVGLRLSSANYLSLVIRTALSFLGRYCGIAPATTTILKMMSRLFSAVTGAARVLVVYSNGKSEEVGPRGESISSVDPLLSRAFFLKVHQFNQPEGILSCKLLDERLRSALLDWFGYLPRQAFFFIVELIADEKEEKALILLPVSPSSRIFGLQRTFMALSTMLGVARISFTSARTSFESSDVMLSFQRTIAEREEEFNDIVHLVNNTAQDIAIYCDQAREKLKTSPDKKTAAKSDQLLRSIEFCSRSLSLGISDLKLIKEITSLRALERSEAAPLHDILEDLSAFGAFHSSRRSQKFEIDQNLPEKTAVRVASREYFETILRLLVRIAARRCRASGIIRIQVRCDNANVDFKVLDTGEVGEYYDSDAIAARGLASNSSISQDYLKAAHEFARLSSGLFGSEEPPPGFSGSLKLSLPRAEMKAGSVIVPGQWVLLVDDNAQVTTFYARVAEALQLRYFTAASVADACKIIDEQGKPRLVITDLQLGDSNGFELIQLVRDRFGSEIPVIVVSGNPEDGLASRLKEYGATKYLIKPVGRRRLFAEIKSIL